MKAELSLQPDIQIYQEQTFRLSENNNQRAVKKKNTNRLESRRTTEILLNMHVLFLEIQEESIRKLSDGNQGTSTRWSKSCLEAEEKWRPISNEIFEGREPVINKTGLSPNIQKFIRA
jgi:hypothetical protein